MSRKKISLDSINYIKYPRMDRNEIDIARRHKIDREKYMEVEETNKLLETILNSHLDTMERDYAIIYLSAAMGLRVSEIVRFNVEETMSPLKKVGNVLLRISKRRKSNPMIEYPVSPDVKAFLLSYMDNLEPHKPVTWFFPSHSKTGHITTRTVQRMFDRYMRLAGLPKAKSFHSLRHGLGVMVQRQTKDINITKKILRHKDISSTQIYIHFTDEETKQIISELPRLGSFPGIVPSTVEVKEETNG